MAAAAATVAAPHARGANDTWKTAASGTWGLNASWADNSVPTNSDQATFNLAGTYTANFDFTTAAIQNLSVLNGGTNVRFQTAPFTGGPFTLNVTSASGGRDATLLGGSVLTLGGTAIVPPSALHLNVGDDLFVGTGSTLNVTRASQLAANDCLVNTGSLNFSSGGDGTFVNMQIGIAAGPATTAVSGAGATLNTSGTFDVGIGATALLTIQGGGTASQTGAARLGVNGGSTGTLTVNGAGSIWAPGSAVDIGVSGTGVLNVQGGGAFSCTGNGNRRIGVNSGSTGAVTVSGAGSSWTTSSTSNVVEIGSGGTGTLAITNGGFVSFVSLSGICPATIGAGTSSQGTVTVNGNGSTWNCGDLLVGDEGRGTLLIEAGGSVSSQQSRISGSGDSAVTVTGEGSTWAYDTLVMSSNSSLRIEAGGAVSGSDASIQFGTATVTGPGSTWTTEGIASIGGSFFGSSSVVVTGAGSSWTIAGDLRMIPVVFVSIVNGATLSILDGGVVTVGGSIVGINSGPSSIILDGSTLDMTRHNIGGAGGAAIDALDIRSGTLKNVAQINNGAGLTKTTAGTLALDGTNTYTGTTTVSAGTLVFNTTYTSGSALDVADGAVAKIGQSLATPNNVVLRTPTISTNATGKLDVSDNKIIMPGASVAAVTALVRSGLNGGGWDGSGIVTSMLDALASLTTIGVATAAQTGHTGGTFGGVSVTDNDVLVMYTYAGDANLDGTINPDDYALISFNDPNPAAKGYFNGDFNYDGDINADDFASIDFNFNAQGAPFPTGGALNAVAAVPEPAGLGIPGALLVACARRGRRVSEVGEIYRSPLSP
jgi:T5SS/PEP-CTERM-associated repeat protein/autotransporter-associated beta strand protein